MRTRKRVLPATATVAGLISAGVLISTMATATMAIRIPTSSVTLAAALTAVCLWCLFTFAANGAFAALTSSVSATWIAMSDQPRADVDSIDGRRASFLIGRMGSVRPNPARSTTVRSIFSSSVRASCRQIGSYGTDEPRHGSCPAPGSTSFGFRNTCERTGLPVVGVRDFALEVHGTHCLAILDRVGTDWVAETSEARANAARQVAESAAWHHLISDKFNQFRMRGDHSANHLDGLAGGGHIVDDNVGKWSPGNWSLRDAVGLRLLARTPRSVRGRSGTACSPAAHRIRDRRKAAGAPPPSQRMRRDSTQLTTR
ncbi:hypothetical protein [Actinocrispum wychmicini]|uniref:Uncharacterized protein n=1 Tax=Actinocrispum wychmicini TaxID=1213861 RepID=A0A4R2JE79_9PSEU|nr:hypothetical protein [Actinocrispum wychmicini]TCO52555.1 hypothetical protein EV192_112287 [Actinocrispum wychmicini]